MPCLQVGALEAIRVKILVKGSPSQLDSVRVRTQRLLAAAEQPQFSMDRQRIGKQGTTRVRRQDRH